MFKNWRTTALGVVLATLGAFAAIDGWDKLSPKQALLALGGCALYALKGALTSDAKTAAAEAEKKA